MGKEVERQAKVIGDPIIAEYVNRIGQNLVRNFHAKVPFTIKVLDSNEVNAFALPGGLRTGRSCEGRLEQVAGR
jgi:predicted Zn-dependent protease